MPPHMRTDARKDKSWVETREQVAALNAVQSELVALPRAIDGPMHWLVVLGVCAVESLHSTINSTMHKLLDDKHNRIDAPRDTLNLHLWHYDADNEHDEPFQEYANRSWYREMTSRAAVRHIGFRLQTGCKLEYWRQSMRIALGLEAPHNLMRPIERGQRRAHALYTHVWFLDTDLDFRFFDLPAFRALIAHTAPLLAQPAVLPRSRSARATDYEQLKARPATNATSLLGRPRLVTDAVKGGAATIIEVCVQALTAVLPPLVTRGIPLW